MSIIRLEAHQVHRGGALAQPVSRYHTWSCPVGVAIGSAVGLLIGAIATSGSYSPACKCRVPACNTAVVPPDDHLHAAQPSRRPRPQASVDAGPVPRHVEEDSVGTDAISEAALPRADQNAPPGTLTGRYTVDCAHIPIFAPVLAVFCVHWLNSAFWLSQTWEEALNTMNAVVADGGRTVSRAEWAARAFRERQRRQALLQSNVTGATAAPSARSRERRPRAELMPEDEVQLRRDSYAATTKTRCHIPPGHPLVDVAAALHVAPSGHVLVDVGSSIGHFSLFALSLGRTVYAFEPILALVSKQCESVSFTRRLKGLSDVPFHLHRVAVGAHTGVLVNVTRPVAHLGDIDSSSVRESNVDHIGPALKSKEVVPMVRLDDVIPADVRVGVMKIDVQGLEDEVLRGANNTLARTHLLVWEQREGLTAATGHSSSKIVKWLRAAHGFQCRICGGGATGDWCCSRPDR